MAEDLIGTYLTIIGKVSIVSDGYAVKAVYLPSSNLPPVKIGTNPLMEEAAAEINEYLNGARKTFTVPICPEGTDFQKAVWEAIDEIPYGYTSTYKDIAEACGRPNAFRAVGTACGANPIPLIVPCHRVLSSNGLGGYSGGLSIKKKLLALERDFL